MKKTYTAAERKEQLINIGAKLGAKLGIVNVQRQLVADKAGVAHSLVSVYLGDQANAQKLYRARMKKLGLKEPDADKIDDIGVAARKHKKGDKRDTRKRSAKEVEAIKRKRIPTVVLPPIPAKKLAGLVGAKKSAGAAANAVRKAGTKTAVTAASTRSPESKPASPNERKPTKPASKKPSAPRSQPADAPAERKSAARSPMQPPRAVEPARPVDPVEFPRTLSGAFP